jgi:hypothetical protein
VAAGWRTTPFGSRFSEGTRVALPEAQSAAVRLRARAKGNPSIPEPDFAGAGIFCLNAEWTIQNGIYIGHVPVLLHDGSFDPLLPWTMTRAGKPQLRLHSVGFGSTLEWPGWDVDLHITVAAPSIKHEPVYREWQRRFFPGGLPSLGKRRR